MISLNDKPIIDIDIKKRTVFYAAPFTSMIEYDKFYFGQIMKIITKKIEEKTDPNDRYEAWETRDKNGVFNYGKLQMILKMRLRVGEKL